MARGALGLHRVPLRELVGSEDGADAVVEAAAELLELRALRLERRLEGIHLRRVVGLLRFEEFLVRGAGLLCSLDATVPAADGRGSFDSVW